MLRRLVTSSCCGHVDESATGLSLSPHRQHGTGCHLPTQLKLMRSTTTFRRQLKTFLFSSTIVLRCTFGIPVSRERNTNNSVTVTVA